VQSVYLENGRVEIRDVPIPPRPKGFALLRLVCAGICNTDLELQRGYYGFTGTPGHEFVGEVVEADTPAWIGRRVVGEINLACTTCDMCRRGLGRHCPNRTVLGIVQHPGAFQEFFTLPERNLYALPDDIETIHAVFTEPLAAACEVLDQVAIPSGAPVALLGRGKLGHLIEQVLTLDGCDVQTFGRGDYPLGAFDWVVEATGSPEGLTTAIRMARPRGTVIMKSTVHGAVPIDTAVVIVNEITLVGSRCGRFEAALAILPRINFDGMIADTMLLRDAPAAFAKAAERGAVKVLMTL
jgi:threonine dehydrogenase-like Zn-dependent dehydrogenase